MITITDLENQYIEHTKKSMIIDSESARDEILFYADLLNNIRKINDNSFTSKLLMQGCRETIRQIFSIFPELWVIE